MPSVTMSTRLAADPEQLWKAIGGFAAIADWHPAVEKAELQGEGEGKGTLRVLQLAGGGKIVERLEEIGPKERVYSYSIVEAPLPVANYRAEIRVVDNGDGTSTVTWSSSFEPAGVEESKAVEVIRGIYEAGLENLRRMYGGA